MKKLPLLLLLVFVVVSSSAHAQVGVYGQLNLTHDSSDSDWYHGFNAGLYDTLFKAGPVRLALDGRAAYAVGDQQDFRSFLAGPRLQIKPPVVPIGPYIQAAVGFGGAKYSGTSPFSQHFNNKLQYGLIAGLDYTVLPRIDLRLPEVEYLRSSSVTFGTGATNLISLSAGIVVRLP